jgi:hypothetical protein
MTSALRTAVGSENGLVSVRQRDIEPVGSYSTAMLREQE